MAGTERDPSDDIQTPASWRPQGSEPQNGRQEPGRGRATARVLVLGSSLLLALLTISPLFSQDGTPWEDPVGVPEPATWPDGAQDAQDGDPLFDEWDDDWIEPPATPGDGAAEEPDRDPWKIDLYHGVRFRGPDGVPRLHFGGSIDLAGDWRDRRNQRDSGVLAERGELRLDGEALDIAWLTVVADLDGRETRDGLRQAVFATQVHPFLRLSVGLQEAPIGLEASFDRHSLPFSDVAFGPDLNERTDLGIRIDGEFLDGFLSYDLSYLAGEGFDREGERVGDPRAAARLVLYPFSPNFVTPEVHGAARHLHGLFFSAGFALEDGFDRRIFVETPRHDRLFETIPMEAGQAEWWSFGWGLDAGRFRILHEWTYGSLEDLRVGAAEIDLRDQITAMAASISYRIGGEPYDSRPVRARPIRQVPDWDESEEPHPWSWPGEIELGLRYANGDIDRRLFELGLADFSVSSQEFRTITASIGIRPSPQLRILLEGTRVIADQRPAAFDSHGRDTSASLRFVISF